MGSSDSTASDIPPNRLDGVPTRDDPIETRLEIGSVTGVHRAGTYYDFSQAFGGSPSVVLTGQDIGSSSPELSSQPARGSFQAQVRVAGSHTIHYTAHGPR